MNKDDYVKSVDQLHISPDFNDKTARLMKATLNHKKKKYPTSKKLLLTFASAAIIISGSTFALNYSNNDTTIENNTEDPIITSDQGITVAEIELPTGSGESSKMLPLFVYQGRVYLHYNTAIETSDGFLIDKDDMLDLRGDYLGKTLGSLDEWSNQDDYATEFASSIGDGDVYTVKGYDSTFRLMVYSEYPDGFSCEIYDSSGGLILKSGADYFDLLQLKDNISSFQWESYDSWNNGKNELTDANIDDVFEKFIEMLYTSTPVEDPMDLLTDSTEYDSQKIIYLKTKDHLITSVRLDKAGYVYIPNVCYFKVDQNAFDAFWNTMPVSALSVVTK